LARGLVEDCETRASGYVPCGSPQISRDIAAVHLLRLIPLTSLCILGADAALAQSPAPACAAATFSARGEPASIRWLALVKARGNWRSRVRGMPELGAPFADWSAANDPTERCIENAGSIVCTVNGVPCRR
jgi:hypothetical protein